VEEGLLNLHASTIIAEVKRYLSVSPDILLGYCAWLRFNLDLVWMVVSPCGAVAPAYGALTDIGIFGQSWNCNCDGAAVTAGADWSVFGCHLLVCSYSRDLGPEVRRCCNSDLSKGVCFEHRLQHRRDSTGHLCRLSIAERTKVAPSTPPSIISALPAQVQRNGLTCKANSEVPRLEEDPCRLEQ
jgi:hypothetical protein